MQDGAGTYHTDAAIGEELLAQDSPGDELFEGEDPKEMQTRSWSSILYIEKGRRRK